MKNQALFSLKDKSKKLKCCLLQFLFGGLNIAQEGRFVLVSLDQQNMNSFTFYELAHYHSDQN